MKLMIAGSRSITDFDISPYIPAEADAVLVIWNGRSKGTQYTLEYAKRINKSTILVRPTPDYTE